MAYSYMVKSMKKVEHLLTAVKAGVK
jgi:hypothetical protein